MRASRNALVSSLSSLSIDDLNKIPEGFNNNIAWNLGHIVAVEQLLIYGLTKQTMVVDPFIVTNFRNKTKPEQPYTQDEIDSIFKYAQTTTDILEKNYNEGLFKEMTPFESKMMNKSFNTVEEIIVFNLYHEGLHAGVIQKYAQILKSNL